MINYTESMHFIKNFDQLAITPERKVVLELVEAALDSIQPEHVMNTHFVLEGSTLRIQDKTFDLKLFERIFLLGFGKGSAEISKTIEQTLSDKLTEGYCVDVTKQQLSKIHFTLGTHPLPSQANFDFTKKVIEQLSNLTANDLVLVVICGGGSAMLVAPNTLTLEQKITVNKSLLKSGANITEMNIVRKHLSKVKGGGLARLFYPATVASLIFSDVPGNDLSTIASGATVKDTTTIDDAWNIIQKYNLASDLNLIKESFAETPKEDKYFEKVSNILVLSNLTALDAMKKVAQEKNIPVEVYSDKFQSDANTAGKTLIDSTKLNSILLTGGETTVRVTGTGRGGRNQQLVLAALPQLKNGTVICSFDSDGWDFDTLAGAIGDIYTLEKARELNLNYEDFLKNNDSLSFFLQEGDGINTGRLPSNVSDIIIVYKK